MAYEQLNQYIQQQRQLGVPDLTIRQLLASQGWNQVDIDEAFATQNTTTPTENAFQLSTTELLGFGELVSKAWNLAKGKYVKVVAIQIIGASPYLLNELLDTLLRVSGPSTSQQTSVLIYSFLSLAGMLGMQWATLASLYCVAKSTTIMESFRAVSMGRIIKFWWLIIMQALIVMGGYILLIIPGIVLSIQTCLTYHIFLFEDIRGLTAIKKSRFFVKGFTSQLFQRYFMLSIAIGVISLPLFGMMSWITYMQRGDIVAQNTLSLIMTILVFLITPITYAFSYLIYENLKAIKSNQTFDPASDGSAKYIALAILGVLAPLALLGVFGWLILSVMQGHQP